MSIPRPPSPPFDVKDNEVQAYLIELNKWATIIYKTFRSIDFGPVRLSQNDSAPTGGEDGDLHIRKDAANTAFYQNVNGVWGAL
jgi:hypothetical protein